MDRVPLKAQARTILGKKVKKLRRDGIIPGHVFGNKISTEHVSVSERDFLKVFHQVGETGLVDLRIDTDKVKPVLIRDVAKDPVSGKALNIDFYQVNLLEKVKVPVPVVQIGEEPEAVHVGEAVVIQPISEVEVEALPADLPEKIEVDISFLKEIDDSILISQLIIPQGVEILTDPEAVVVKLDTAVSEEMEKLLEEQAAETAAAAETAEAKEGEASAEEGAEKGAGEVPEGEAAGIKEGGEEQKEPIEQSQ